MWYTYVLKSKKDGDLYIGMTNDLKKRVDKHNSGEVESTKFRTPFELIYYEAHHNKNDVAKREKFLKTGWGRNWISRTLENYLKSKS